MIDHVNSYWLLPHFIDLNHAPCICIFLFIFQMNLLFMGLVKHLYISEKKMQKIKPVSSLFLLCICVKCLLFVMEENIWCWDFVLSHYLPDWPLTPPLMDPPPKAPLNIFGAKTLQLMWLQIILVQISMCVFGVLCSVFPSVVKSRSQRVLRRQMVRFCVNPPSV